MAQSELLSAKKSATQGAREASAALRLRSSRETGHLTSYRRATNSQLPTGCWFTTNGKIAKHLSEGGGMTLNFDSEKR
jgi:hypothetical protein